MKLLTIITATALAATPVLAETPAEKFGQSHTSGTASHAAYAAAVVALSGDNVDDQIPAETNASVTRSTSAGHLQLAKNMGVSPNEFTTAELAKMFIGAYD